MSEFKIIETQEELNAIIGDRIARAKESTRKEFEGWISPEQLSTEIGQLNETIKNTNAELEQLKSESQSKDKQIANYETAAVKGRVAREVGLGFDSIDFITGTNEEEIKASANALKKLIGTNNTQPRFKQETATENPLKSMLAGLNQD